MTVEIKKSQKKYDDVKGCSIALFGIPVVASDKLEKLKGVLGKLFSTASSEYQDYYPLDEKDQTKGYCFLKCKSEECAKAASLLLDDYRFGSKHRFSVFNLDALPKKSSKELKEPEKTKYNIIRDLWSWTQNTGCLDQFAVQFNASEQGRGKSKSAVCETNLAVYWNGHGGKEPKLALNEIRENWSEKGFEWSPEGSYIATIHKPGIKLWGGAEFEPISSFTLDNVEYVQFSPKERFLVAYIRRRNRPDCLQIFDVVTGEMKSSISNATDSVKWSWDEKYFAFFRPENSSILLHDVQSSKESPIKFVCLSAFEWNPAKNLLAYYCAEKLDQSLPAEIGIFDVSSFKKVRSQSSFRVTSAKLFWQKSGSFLAGYTERYQNIKTKKHFKKNDKGEEVVDDDGKKVVVITETRTHPSSHLEIFDCTETNISVITMDLAEAFVDFEWESQGDKFCVLIGSENRVSPHIYQLQNGKAVLLSKLDAAQLVSLSWAPHGGWLCVYGTSSVFFIDASGTEVVRIRTVEHNSLNQVCWDPTGRYLVTCCIGFESEGGAYRIHTFLGREVYRKNGETALISFKWRPRPPAPIEKGKAKEIRQSLKEMSKKFDDDDRQEQMSIFKDLHSHHLLSMEAFKVIVEENCRLYEEQHEERIKLRNFDCDVITNEELVDEVVTVPLTTVTKEVECR